MQPFSNMLAFFRAKISHSENGLPTVRYLGGVLGLLASELSLGVSDKNFSLNMQACVTFRGTI